MKISKIEYKNNINFNSAHRVYAKKNVKNFNFLESSHVHTTTNLFREDLHWTDFINYITRNFKDKNKVNAYSLACSDGSEAYSYAVAILEKCKENISKYLPITACDIDPEMIEAAKAGRINIYGGEFKVIEKLGFNIRDYFINPAYPKQFTDDEVYMYVNSASYEPVQKLKDSVIFKKTDILTELENINDDGNSVIMCRNVFPYLQQTYIDKVIKTAQDVLKKGSLFVIGGFDYRAGIDKMLQENGFYRPLITSYNIFQRGEIKEVTDRLLMGYLI